MNSIAIFFSRLFVNIMEILGFATPFIIIFLIVYFFIKRKNKK